MFACDHETSFDLVRRHTVEVHPTSATGSLWTVRYNAHGNLLKRADTVDAMNTLDTIRTIITSQQSVDKRKDQYVAVDTDFA